MPLSLRVRILGREYPLRVREDDEAMMLEIAAAVDERMQAFRKSHPGEPELTAAVFSALALAVELRAAQDHERRAEAHLAKELDALTAQLAEALGLSDRPASDGSAAHAPGSSAPEN